MKETKRGVLSVNVDGKSYRGSRTIVGTRKLSQTVHYHGKSHIDPAAYKPGQRVLMDWVARTFLGEMVLREYHSNLFKTRKRT